MNDNVVNLNIFYSRMNKFDTEGLLEINSTGFPCEFTTSAVGPVYINHEGNSENMPDMLAFTAELRELMKKYFNGVPALW